MENLKLNIFDLTTKDDILAYRESQNSFDDNINNLRYGIDYDYIVESFLCEFKLDVKTLKSLQEEYKRASSLDEKEIISTQFFELYPEAPSIDVKNIPDTILKKIYIVQSPKGYDGLPSVHYSVNEIALSHLRALRKKVKKDMFNAAQAGDSVSETRYNAKQLAIKVVCNSEYGASNNEYFAHYDPDIASCVTRGARRLIGFLTENLEHDELFVDDKFIKSNQTDIDNLSKIQALKIEQLSNPNEEYLLTQRRHCIRRLFDDSFNLMKQNIFRISLHPSTVCYQDTDSNYYKNEYISNYYFQPDPETGEIVSDPEIIDNCMHSMLHLNNLIGNFIKDSINRRPYELGFEGAFIVCRYLNRKKKYYGIKWGDDAELRLTKTLPDSRAYEDNDFNKDLIPDYMPYWVPKKSVVPQPNGDYIYIDVDKLLHQGVNYLDYVHDQDVKCTGVDLARRDQYKFINFFHIVVLQKDLRLMKYNGYGEWQTFKTDEPMKEVIDEVITTFQNIIKSYTDIANFKSQTLPQYDFNILDFAKNGAYRYGKQNTVSQIVRRLEKENKQQYIPEIGERMTYVTILDEQTKQNRNAGIAKETNASDRSIVVQELLDQLMSEYSVSYFENERNKNNLHELTYETYINAKAICSLDIKNYLEHLCKSMALYVVADEFPNEIKQIDDGIISPKEAGLLISKLQEKIAKQYIDKYFPKGYLVKSQLKVTKPKIATTKSETSESIVRASFNNSNEIITSAEIANYIHTTEQDIKQIQQERKRAYDVLSFILTNHFNTFYSKNETKQNYYSQYHNKPTKLKQIIDGFDYKLAKLERILNSLKTYKL